MTDMSDALVLGGGGIAGIAWITGLLAGMADAGGDATAVDLIVGTSAGATVAAQIGSGEDLDLLFARQVDPSRQSAEITADIDMERFGTELLALTQGASSPSEMHRAVGRFALDASTVPEAVRRAVIESRLPDHRWPSRTIKLVAVDAESGAPRVFDRSSGVSLVDAVAASCAVPGVWPPVTIEGHRYIDGGIRSNENADLAAGASQVLVIAPLGRVALFPTDKPLDRTLDELRSGGAAVAVVVPDEESTSAFGANPLDPSTRVPAAAAGRAQGRGLTFAWERASA